MKGFNEDGFLGLPDWSVLFVRCKKEKEKSWYVIKKLTKTQVSLFVSLFKGNFVDTI